MEIVFLGKKLNVSDGMRNYMKIVADFREMSEKATKTFNGDIANFLLERYEENALNHYFDDFVGETRKYLSQYGVYTLSDNEIFQAIISDNRGRNRDKTHLQIEFDDAFEKIVENTPNYESQDDRTYYAVKKSLDLLNSGYFNGAITFDIMALCDFVIAYLTDNELFDIQLVYQDDSNKAKAIYQNLLSGNIPEAEKNNLAFSLIELDYSEEDYYIYIFNTFPQSRFETATIANYLGIDLSDLIEKEIKRDFNLKIISCEEDALKMMEDLNSTMEKYCRERCSVKIAAEV